ncbi:Leucine-rich receptor-like protein kinase family protein [Dorcoceras hygrometricum]|uniref:Leucine-rich receptor-like protein kinase family protein n=1 Tax=Dorcoceras hygrometricum TaxID=472368 RepID=A0A2Z7D798_9LAMI|nr:Leucine-rich receptor-like protein kinase family protein [Dorcoceras hygrometricum]
MGYVTIAASSCHKRYNQHAAFQLIKTTSPHHQRLVARNNLNDIVMNTSYSLLSADQHLLHSKRCVLTSIKQHRFSPATGSSHQQLVTQLQANPSQRNSWLPSRKKTPHNATTNQRNDWFSQNNRVSLLYHQQLVVFNQLSSKHQDIRFLPKFTNSTSNFNPISFERIST